MKEGCIEVKCTKCCSHGRGKQLGALADAVLLVVAGDRDDARLGRLRALVLRRAVWPRYSHHPSGWSASFRQIRSGERRCSAVCCAAGLRARHRRGKGSVGAGEPAVGAQR